MPTKSNAPIIARAEAASTSGMPKSAQSEMKCVWINPLVLSPQIKKVANRIQNVEERAPSPNALKACAMAGRRAGGAGGGAF